MGTELPIDILNPSDDTKEAVNYFPNPATVSSIDYGASYAVRMGMQGGIDSFSKIVLHGDSLPIIDSSLSPHTFSNSGVTIDTTNKKFGNGSLDFASSANCDSVASSDWDLGTLWTVDLWIRPTTSGTYQKFISTQFGATYYEILITNTGQIGWQQSGSAFLFGTGALTLNIFQHVAVTYDGANIKIWINGVLDSTTAYVTTFDSGGNALRLGKAGGGAEPFTGQLDEVRISKGILRYTAPFTPPLLPYDTTTPGVSSGTFEKTEQTTPEIDTKLFGRNVSNEPIEISRKNANKSIVSDFGNVSGSISPDFTSAEELTMATTAAVTDLGGMTGLGINEAGILTINNSGGYAVDTNSISILTAVDTGIYNKAFVNRAGIYYYIDVGGEEKEI